MPYTRVERPGIAIAVEIDGPIAGVTYVAYNRKPLVLDCSLVVSLARVGRHLRERGIERARYSSSYQRRKIRGTDRWSQHSFGLALDVHVFSGETAGEVRVVDDYERGLGDELDCIGQPRTNGGLILRTLVCQFERSGQFRFILNPDSDAAHHNHFHLEAHPWPRRLAAQSE